MKVGHIPWLTLLLRIQVIIQYMVRIAEEVASKKALS